MRITAIEGAGARAAQGGRAQHRRTRPARPPRGARAGPRLRAGAGEGHPARLGDGRIGRVLRRGAGRGQRAAGDAGPDRRPLPLRAHRRVGGQRQRARRQRGRDAPRRPGAGHPRSAARPSPCLPPGSPACWCIRTRCSRRAPRGRCSTVPSSWRSSSSRAPTSPCVLAGCYRGDLDAIRAGLQRRAGGTAACAAGPRLRRGEGGRARRRCAGGEPLRRRTERLRLVHRRDRRRGSPRRWPGPSARAGVGCDVVISPVAAPGARVVSCVS